MDEGGTGPMMPRVWIRLWTLKIRRGFSSFQRFSRRRNWWAPICVEFHFVSFPHLRTLGSCWFGPK